MNKKGFTISEVLTVIIIISIIITIAIPSISTITDRINKRLLEGKKEVILSAAEQYGKDNESLFMLSDNVTIYLYQLIEQEYIDKDVDFNEDNCTNSTIDYKGCVINPVDKTSLNNTIILLKKDGDTITAVWNGSAQTTSSTLVEIVKSRLACNPTASAPCIYKGRNPDNYLYYSGVMWRIMGVYVIDGVETVKLITDDTISWEETAS